MLGPITQPRIRARIAAFDLFDPALYLALHPDLQLAQVNPFEHFASAGLWERRIFAKPTNIARAFGSVSTTAHEPCDIDGGTLSQLLSKVRKLGTIGVYVSSLGNFF